MATHFFGLNSGLTASVDLHDISTTNILNDIQEAVSQSNIIVGLTQAQYNALFDVSAGGGLLQLSVPALQQLIADCINNQAGANFVKRTGSVGGGDINDGCDVGTSTDSSNYNLVDLALACRDYLRPSTYLATLKNTFITTSLGTTFNDISDVLPNLRTRFTELGFFTDLDTSFGAISVSGDAENNILPGDVSVNTAGFLGTNDVSLFTAIADAGYLSSSATGMDLSLEDGFAIHMALTLAGSSTITLKYSADTSIVGGSTPLNDLVGILEGTVTQHINKKLSDEGITNIIHGDTAPEGSTDSVTIPILLMKVT
jgi:hypothetical protein